MLIACNYLLSTSITGLFLVLKINLHSWIGLVVGQVVRPPNYSPDAIPETGFTCEDKITGGYYADPEADCQLFHVCVQVSEYEVGQQVSFFSIFTFNCFVLLKWFCYLILFLLTLLVIH